MWLHLDRLPQNLDWILLENLELVNYSILKQCAEFLRPEIAVNDDLFDEVCCLQRIIPELSMSSFESLSLDQRWATITKQFSTIDDYYFCYTCFECLL